MWYKMPNTLIYISLHLLFLIKLSYFKQWVFITSLSYHILFKFHVVRITLGMIFEILNNIQFFLFHAI